MPDVRLQVALEAGQGGNLRSVVQVLEHDPKDKLAAALARLGRAFMARELVSFPDCTRCRETLPNFNSWDTAPTDLANISDRRKTRLLLNGSSGSVRAP